MYEDDTWCMGIVISIAAENGYLDVLEKYWSNVPENIKPDLFDFDMCADAAFGGHMETLQWLRSQGCPWDERVCGGAAHNGDLNMLQWARSQGCPWDLFTTLFAAEKDHLDIFQWSLSQGCPCCLDSCLQSGKPNIQSFILLGQIYRLLHPTGPDQ